MHETNAEFETRDEENVVGIWALGLIIIVLGGVAILYYIRYVAPFQQFCFLSFFPHFLYSLKYRMVSCGIMSKHLILVHHKYLIFVSIGAVRTVSNSHATHFILGYGAKIFKSLIWLFAHLVFTHFKSLKYLNAFNTCLALNRLNSISISPKNLFN